MRIAINIGAIGLALLILFQGAGMLILYRIRQLIAQAEMETHLSSTPATDIFHIPVENYRRCKERRREITIDGKLYDIKSVEIKGDIAVVHVIHDEYEENILQRIVDYISHGHRPLKSWPNPINKILSLNYLLPDTYRAAISFTKCAPAIPFVNDLHGLYHIDTPCPPPWCC